MPLSAVPCLIIEEHHEAFYAWHAAVRAGWIAPQGNQLLHVDEHADMDAPRLLQPVPRWDTPPEEVEQFVFDQLCCSEFIVPAIYRGLISTQAWLHHHTDDPSETRFEVSSLSGRGQSLLLRRLGDSSAAANAKSTDAAAALRPGEDAVVFSDRRLTCQTDWTAVGDLLLDIDLDYFSCETTSRLVERVEVTAAEAESYRRNPYHFLRIHQGSRIRLHQEDGRFFLYLKGYAEPTPSLLKVDETVIRQRVAALIDYLNRNRLMPRLITVARSRRSGYTPADQWQLIEAHLLDALGRRTALEILPVDRWYVGLAGSSKTGQQRTIESSSGTTPELSAVDSQPPVHLDEHVAAALSLHLPDALFGPEDCRRLVAVARHLPANLSEFFGFEVRLGTPRPGADFLVCIKAETSGRQVLAGWRQATDWWSPLSGGRAWQQVRQWSKRWCDANGPLASEVQNAWLEFDLIEPAMNADPASRSTSPQSISPSMPPPSLFFGSAPRASSHAGEVLLPSTQQGKDWFTPVLAALVEAGGSAADSANQRIPSAAGCDAADRGAASSSTAGPYVSSEQQQAIHRCLAALPPRANVFQVGRMLARPESTAVRLCIRGIGRHEIVPYLANVGWSGQMQLLETLLDGLAARADRADLDIDVEATVRPKIGLECWFHEEPSARSRFQSFLEHLVERGLCTTAKAQGLLTWSRLLHQRQQGLAWPRDLVERAARCWPPTISALARWVYHIKLVVPAQGDVEAKAYLAVQQAWLTAAVVQQMLRMQQGIT